MQIASKGRVAVPQKKIGNERGLSPHNQAEFEMKGDDAHLCEEPRPSKAKSRGESAIEALRGAADVPMTTDEIMALTRGEHE